MRTTRETGGSAMNVMPKLSIGRPFLSPALGGNQPGRGQPHQGPRHRSRPSSPVLDPLLSLDGLPDPTGSGGNPPGWRPTRPQPDHSSSKPRASDARMRPPTKEGPTPFPEYPTP